MLDPGLSFGTGQHATTRFCLGEIVRSRPHSKTSDSAKRSFLDMGTGSGILAIAAAKLGYSPVEAFDFDPDCVRIARENAALNQLESRVTIHQQDVTRLPTKAKTRFNVVCANLIYDLLIAEAERIASRLQPGGVLILAGILSSQFAEVQSAYESVGLRLMRSKSEKEWCSGAFRVR